MLAVALVAFSPLVAALYFARLDDRRKFVERSCLLRDGVTGTTRLRVSAPALPNESSAGGYRRSL